MPERTLLDQYKDMTGANQFLADHCKKTLEELEKYYRGVSHTINRCNAEYVDCWNAVKVLGKHCEALRKAQSDYNAEIGRLQEESKNRDAKIKKLEEAVEGARKAYAELLEKNTKPLS